MKYKPQRFSKKILLDAQEAPVYAYCAECGGEVYGEELVYEIDGETVCEECIGEFARKYFLPERIKGKNLTGGHCTYETE